MATKSASTLERTYTVPLRKEFLKVPNWLRSKKSITALKQFLQRHMKAEDVRLSKALNEEIWKHGIKNPPGKVKVNVTKDDKGIVRAELFGYKEKVREEKKIKKTSSPPQDKK